MNESSPPKQTAPPRPETKGSIRLMGVLMLGFIALLLFLQRNTATYWLAGIGSVFALAYLLVPGYFVAADKRRRERQAKGE